MQKSNIKMKNNRLKFKNELKIETTNHTNNTNINKKVFIFNVNKNDCFKFICEICAICC